MPISMQSVLFAGGLAVVTPLSASAGLVQLRSGVSITEAPQQLSGTLDIIGTALASKSGVPTMTMCSVTVSTDTLAPAGLSNRCILPRLLRRKQETRRCGIVFPRLHHRTADSTVKMGTPRRE